MKRRISILLVVSMLLTQLMPWFPSITAYAAEGDRIDLYKGEEVQIHSEKNPLAAMEETADLSVGTYLKVLVSLDGVEKGKQVFQYDQNPGKLLLVQKESYGVHEIKLDGTVFDPNAELTFSQENQIRTLEVALYTKAKLTVHYQDVNGTSISDDAIVEGKLNETVVAEVKSIEGYEPLQADCQVTLDSSTKETVIQYQEKPTVTEEPKKEETAPDVKDPTTEEKNPNTDAKDPATEEKDPTTNEKNPGTEKDPVVEEKDPNGKENSEEKPEDPAAGEEQVAPEENPGSGEAGTAAPGEVMLEGAYEPGYEMNIVGNRISFDVRTSPVESGELFVKLPAFFKFVTIPDKSSDFYVYPTTTETIDKNDQELGTILGGEKREVLRILYNKPTDIVRFSFAIELKDERGLSNAMALAGEHPDQVPLNIDLSLEGRSLSKPVKAQIKGTSQLPEENKFTYTTLSGNGPLKLGNEDFLSRPRLEFDTRDTNAGGITGFKIEKYHYPYTGIEIWVPMDVGKKIESISGCNSRGSYEGNEYFVAKLDELDYDGPYYYDTYGDLFKAYTISAYYPTMSLKFNFKKSVQDQETVTFDKPAFLKYTYRGKTEIQELYTIDNYTFHGYAVPGLGWRDEHNNKYNSYSEQVQCGKNIETRFPGWNNDSDILSLDRKDVTVDFHYPYEVQPQRISSFVDDKVNKVDITYRVKNRNTKEERLVTEKSVGTGYVFQITDEEYVSDISLHFSEMKAYESLLFATDNLTTSVHEDGTAIKKAEIVSVKGELTYEGKTSNYVWYNVKLTPLGDCLAVQINKNDLHVILKDDKSIYYNTQFLYIDAYRNEEYMPKDYSDVKFTMQAPPEIMSKINGIILEDSSAEYGKSKVIEGGVTIQYDTNKGTKSKRLNSDDLYLKEDIAFDLDVDEYVTAWSIVFDKLLGSQLSSRYYDIRFAPRLNSKRTYYAKDGTEHPVPLNQSYRFQYSFSTSSLPADKVTNYKMESGIVYKGYETFVIEPYEKVSYEILDAEGRQTSECYRNQTVKARFEFYWLNGSHLSLNPRYRLINELFYFEVIPGFEITGLTVPSSLIRKEKLDNQNTLYVFRTTTKTYGKIGKVDAKIYVRPDAEEKGCSPIVAAGCSHADYLDKIFPDHKNDYENSKKTPPYQIVKKEKSNEAFPANWNVPKREQEFGKFYSMPNSEQNPKVHVLSGVAGTMHMQGRREGLLQGVNTSFKEAHRNSLGASAFITATSGDSIQDYTATFVIPKENEKIQGRYETVTAQYSLYANDSVTVHKNNVEIKPSEYEKNGISVTYYNGTESINPTQESNKLEGRKKMTNGFRDVREIKVHFKTLSSTDAYEVEIPLCADEKAGTTKDIKSYVGTYNQTGNNPIVFNNPACFVYESYMLNSKFDLDQYENGYPSLYYDRFNVKREITLFDENWTPLFESESSKDSYKFTSLMFNANINSVKYVGFSLDPTESDNYFATRILDVSEISDQKIHEFADGRKVWYIEAKAEDFIADSTEDKYDALFVRKPDVVADALNCGIGEEKELPYSYNQPANPNMNKEYQVKVRLVDPKQDIVELIRDGKTYKVKGLKEGKVEYEVIVINTQGMEFTARNTITVGTRQINVTVPLYVCMYAYGGDGKVVAPDGDSYAITNHSDCAVQVSSIQAVESSWKLKDAQNGLQAGEIHMKIGGKTIRTTPTDLSGDAKWLIEKPQDKDVGSKLKLPVHGVIAGGSVNEDGESAVCNVQYTVKPAD